LPIAAPIRRHAAACRIQNDRMALSGCESVKLSAFGWEKQVGLKSSPIPSDFAQSIQPAKCSGPIASRSTRLAPNSP
jgi:hypothetical protein